MNQNNYRKIFEGLRGEKKSTLGIISFLLNNLNSININTIKKIGNELKEYIRIEKSKMLLKVSPESIRIEITRLKEKGASIPHAGLLATESQPYNIEKLMFPDEFHSLYKLQNLIYIIANSHPTKPYKSFESYFDKNIDINKIIKLKSIFNRNDSPQEYAMMTGILIELNIIKVSNKGFKDFFRAWYDFIGRAHTKKFHPSGIYDYFNTATLKYNITNDKLYLSLKKEVENLLFNDSRI